jgi:diguanylate cyclase (GGDEF)-like protein
MAGREKKLPDMKNLMNSASVSSEIRGGCMKNDLRKRRSCMPQSVLIVDDSMPLHTLIKTQLKSEPLRFHSAHDGESGLLTASSFRPDLILLDVDMPGMNGFEVCQRLKANPLTASIPLIFLTAAGTLTDKVKGLELGGTDYIVKPFKPEELKARVHSVLRTAQQLEPTRMIDTPTGLWNRKYFDMQQASQLSVAKRSGRPLSCIVAQVDALPGIRLKFGEPAADEIQRKIGGILTGRARAEDVVCRLDDGKFAMLLIGVSAAGAARLAERLRTEIQRQLQSRSSAEPVVTCSFGVADSLVDASAPLVERAEIGSCRSQELGRNCVSIARDYSIRPAVAA